MKFRVPIVKIHQNNLQIRANVFLALSKLNLFVENIETIPNTTDFIVTLKEGVDLEKACRVIGMCHHHISFTGVRPYHSD